MVPPHDRAACILVVDDDELIVRALTIDLHRRGYRVLSAGDGTQALEVIRREWVDLLLLDLHLPDMEGNELLERLHREEATREVRVLMLSGSRDHEVVIRCIQLGADDYLTKPIDLDLLHARLEACLEKKRLRDREHQLISELQRYRAKLEHELRQASEYVHTLLPKPVREPLPIDWRFQPSAELGGDFFDYAWLEDEVLSFYLLDVEGHGVGAALLSVTLGNLFRAMAPSGANFFDPASVLRSLNKSFALDREDNRFFTIWYGVYRRSQRELCFASAGHPPAILAVPDGSGGRRIQKLQTECPAIGLMPDFFYEPQFIEVPEGSSLLVYSDGASDVHKPTGEMIQFDEFAAPLLELPAPGTPSGGEPFLDRYLRHICDLQGGNPRFDDDLSLLKVDF